MLGLLSLSGSLLGLKITIRIIRVITRIIRVIIRVISAIDPDKPYDRSNPNKTSKPKDNI